MLYNKYIKAFITSLKSITNLVKHQNNVNCLREYCIYSDISQRRTLGFEIYELPIHIPTELLNSK